MMGEEMGQGADAGQEPQVPPGQTPEAPVEAPEEGQADGQGDGQSGHELDPNVTRAQQEAADARKAAEEAVARTRELELENARLTGQAQGQTPATEEPDPAAAAAAAKVDELLAKSQLVTGLRSDVARLEASNVELNFDARKEEFPLMANPEVRKNVLKAVADYGPGASNVEIMRHLYGRHAAPMEHAEKSALATENAALKAELEALKKGQAGNADLSATDIVPSSGGGGGGGAAPVVKDQSMADLEAQIDAHKAQHGGGGTRFHE